MRPQWDEMVGCESWKFRACWDWKPCKFRLWHNGKYRRVYSGWMLLVHNGLGSLLSANISCSFFYYHLLPCPRIPMPCLTNGFVTHYSFRFPFIKVINWSQFELVSCFLGSLSFHLLLFARDLKKGFIVWAYIFTKVGKNMSVLTKHLLVELKI